MAVQKYSICGSVSLIPATYVVWAWKQNKCLRQRFDCNNKNSTTATVNTPRCQFTETKAFNWSQKKQILLLRDTCSFWRFMMIPEKSKTPLQRLQELRFDARLYQGRIWSISLTIIMQRQPIQNVNTEIGMDNMNKHYLCLFSYSTSLKPALLLFRNYWTKHPTFPSLLFVCRGVWASVFPEFLSGSTVASATMPAILILSIVLLAQNCIPETIQTLSILLPEKTVSDL